MSKKKNKSRLSEDAPARIVGPDGQPIENDTPDLSALQAERDDLFARLQRLSADYQNYQKRVQKEQVQHREYANEGLMKSLLAVVDDIERGLAAARENHSADDPLLIGMQLVHDKLMDTLRQFGLETIETEGKHFDPEKHSALLQEPSSSVEPMTVLRVLQAGYAMKGRTLRPASVVVAQAPAKEDEPSEETP